MTNDQPKRPDALRVIMHGPYNGVISQYQKRAEDMLGLTGLGSFNAVDDLDGLLSLANEKGYPDWHSRQILNNVNSKSSLEFL